MAAQRGWGCGAQPGAWASALLLCVTLDATAVGQGKGRCTWHACMACGLSFPHLISLSTGCDSSCLYYVFDEDQVKMVAHEKACIQRKFLWAWVSSDPFPTDHWAL